jgi:NAD(P)-dependent dehydrogenase (short-subunit alcohol dehydrogenase family)
VANQKIIVITGASSGIGLEVAIQLAQLGHRIIMVGRNDAKLIDAHKLIVEKSGNTAISIQVADLSLQREVRKLAFDISQQISHIDVLINNAGAVFAKFELTAEGIEKTIATNHFNYFLLTNLLLDLIKKTQQGRIINVASDSHFAGKIDVESFTKRKNYFILRAYAQSKLGNILFSYELAERLRGTNVTVNALHPGRVRTHIGNKNQPWYFSTGWTLATLLMGSVSTKMAAKTYTYLATSDEVRNTTGKYFDNCKEKSSSLLSYDKKLMKLLWNLSEELCKENF